MNNLTMAFSDFRVGDYIHFSRRFSARDFTEFSKLSGDKNPLHHDKIYSRNTEFGAPIVPLHLCAAPLSAIAGMMLPGDPSLYAEHTLRALKPVFYGQKVTYSARIAAIAPARRALTLSVIAFTETEVVLEAEMNVTARVAEWEGKGAATLRNAGRHRTALVTGATGEIGASVARKFAAEGWHLLLQYRRDEKAAKKLALDCHAQGVTAKIIKADLEKATDVDGLASAISRISDLGAIVHTACPPVSGKLAALAAVNFVAFEAIIKAGLPAMLRRQSGATVFVGSTAMDRGLRGWEQYAAAKAMGQNAVSILDRSYARFGVRGLTVSPGFVQSGFSKPYRDPTIDALAPEEVANAIIERANNPLTAAPYLILEVGRKIEGDYGFHQKAGREDRKTCDETSNPMGLAPAAAVENPSDAPGANTTAELDDVVRRVLRIPAAEDLDSAELGRISTWDSLSHIALMLEIERTLGISFTSEEISTTYSYDGLRSLWLQKQDKL
jgi:short-subunit dehydrogenase/acyl dehydratase/acyl carrier protein